MMTKISEDFCQICVALLFNSFSQQVVFVSQLPTLEFKGCRNHRSKQIRVTAKTLRVCYLFNFAV